VDILEAIGIGPVATDDAKEMARRLAREEALFAGTEAAMRALSP
jgi:cysteine synthase